MVDGILGLYGGEHTNIVAYVFDILLGVLEGNVSANRRYADHVFVSAVVEVLGLNLLIVDVARAGDTLLLSTAGVPIGCGPESTSAMDGLCRCDLALVNYSGLGFEHYVCLGDVDGAPWLAPSNVTTFVSALLAPGSTVSTYTEDGLWV